MTYVLLLITHIYFILYTTDQNLHLRLHKLTIHTYKGNKLELGAPTGGGPIRMFRETWFKPGSGYDHTYFESAF